MQIDVDNRGTGKTTTLIMDSYFTGIPIITTTVTRKNNIKDQALRMGMPDIEVYTVKEAVEHKVDNERGDHCVYVDELQDVINYLLGAKVVKATMTRRP